jgi:phosphoglycerate dehydrogenase-like enzyme
MPKRLIAVLLPRPSQERNLCQQAREQLDAFAQTRYHQGDDPLAEAEKSEFIADAEGILSGWGDTGLTPANLDAAKRLHIITVIGSSVAHFSPDLAFDRGITITNTASAIGYSVAEFALAQMLSLLHQSPARHRAMANPGGPESKDELVGRDLAGRTVGVVGLGSVGRIMVQLLKPFGVQLLLYDPFVSRAWLASLGGEIVSLEELMRRSEVVTLHAGITEQSRGLIGRKELALLRDGAVVVNTARGGLFDQEALVEELQQGRIFAALDVFDPNPGPDHPLRSLPNVLLSPHKAGLTSDTLRRIGLDAVEDLRLFFSGQEPKNRLTREQIMHAT